MMIEISCDVFQFLHSLELPRKTTKTTFLTGPINRRNCAPRRHLFSPNSLARPTRQGRLCSCSSRRVLLLLEAEEEEDLKCFCDSSFSLPWPGSRGKLHLGGPKRKLTCNTQQFGYESIFANCFVRQQQKRQQTRGKGSGKASCLSSSERKQTAQEDQSGRRLRALQPGSFEPEAKVLPLGTINQNLPATGDELAGGSSKGSSSSKVERCLCSPGSSFSLPTSGFRPETFGTLSGNKTGSSSPTAVDTISNKLAGFRRRRQWRKPAPEAAKDENHFEPVWPLPSSQFKNDLQISPDGLLMKQPASFGSSLPSLNVRRFPLKSARQSLKLSPKPSRDKLQQQQQIEKDFNLKEKPLSWAPTSWLFLKTCSKRRRSLHHQQLLGRSRRKSSFNQETGTGAATPLPLLLFLFLSLICFPKLSMVSRRELGRGSNLQSIIAITLQFKLPLSDCLESQRAETTSTTSTFLPPTTSNLQILPKASPPSLLFPGDGSGTASAQIAQNNPSGGLSISIKQPVEASSHKSRGRRNNKIKPFKKVNSKEGKQEVEVEEEEGEVEAGPEVFADTDALELIKLTGNRIDGNMTSSKRPQANNSSRSGSGSETVQATEESLTIANSTTTTTTWPEVWPEAAPSYRWPFVSLVGFMFLGATGNILVCMAVWRERRLQTATNYFLLSLAVADLLVCTLVMPFGIIYEFYGHWPFDWRICNLWVTLDVLTCSSSILHMCFISVGRYLGIRNPLHARQANLFVSRRAVLWRIAIAWLSSALIASPITMMSLYDHRNIVPASLECAISNKYFQIFGSLLAFFLPMFVMVPSYVMTVRLLSQRAKYVRNNSLMLTNPTSSGGQVNLTVSSNQQLPVASGSVHRSRPGSSSSSSKAKQPAPAQQHSPETIGHNRKPEQEELEGWPTTANELTGDIMEPAGAGKRHATGADINHNKQIIAASGHPSLAAAAADSNRKRDVATASVFNASPLAATAAEGNSLESKENSNDAEAKRREEACKEELARKGHQSEKVAIDWQEPRAEKYQRQKHDDDNKKTISNSQEPQSGPAQDASQPQALPVGPKQQNSQHYHSRKTSGPKQLAYPAARQRHVPLPVSLPVPVNSNNDDNNNLPAEAKQASCINCSSNNCADLAGTMIDAASSRTSGPKKRLDVVEEACKKEEEQEEGKSCALNGQETYNYIDDDEDGDEHEELERGEEKVGLEEGRQDGNNVTLLLYSKCLMADDFDGKTGRIKSSCEPSKSLVYNNWPLLNSNNNISKCPKCADQRASLARVDADWNQYGAASSVPSIDRLASSPPLQHQCKRCNKTLSCCKRQPTCCNGSDNRCRRETRTTTRGVGGECNLKSGPSETQEAHAPEAAPNCYLGDHHNNHQQQQQRSQRRHRKRLDSTTGQHHYRELHVQSQESPMAQVACPSALNLQLSASSP